MPWSTMEPEKESKLCDEYDFNLNMHSGIRMKLVHSKPHFGVHTGFESKWPQKMATERLFWASKKDHRKAFE